ncbi:MAG: 50S ribosome-binding GTPase [Candidatus Marsarchaeota archaeon]|nr:50S ribosome-binding GTPase [Candidatus Marsarchaeota archaeon]
MGIPNFKLRSWSMVSRYIGMCQMVLLVVDGRHMSSGRVSRLEREAGRKLVLVATKTDLVPGQPAGLQVLKNGLTIFHVSSKTKAGVEELRKWITTKAYERFARLGKPYMREGTWCNTFDILILGIPNVGKSSLINSMTGRRAALTGFRAGITRGVQWINLAEGIRLIDAPGVVDFAMQEEGLALAGSLDVEKLNDPMGTAQKLIDRFTLAKDHGLANYFDVEYSTDSEKLLAAIALRRGKILKGGEPNLDEAARLVVREYQKGKYGLGGKGKA